MTEDLDISPLAAEMILQALRPVVHEHYDIEAAGVSLEELDIDDGDAMTVDTADGGSRQSGRLSCI